MKVIRTVAKLRAAVDEHRGRGLQIAFVPTMGSLHEGHLSLFDRAGEECSIVVASIFVNPLQFGEGEDLNSYPSDLEGDLQKARSRGVDLAFVPSAREMYPDGPPDVTVDPGPLAQRLCGRFRPGHFRGVLTVVAKLLQMVRPDVAVFGRKDLQQGVLIRRMTEDLNFPVRIVLAPIVREEDGLAMSSRNAFLVGEARVQAAGVSSTLRAVANAFADGVTDTAALRRAVDEHMDLFPGLDVQYADFVALDTLEEVAVANAKTVLALAVLCGGTRLIDNRFLGTANA